MKTQTPSIFKNIKFVLMICTKNKDRNTGVEWAVSMCAQYAEHHSDHTPTSVYYTTVRFLMLNLLSAPDNGIKSILYVSI